MSEIDRKQDEYDEEDYLSDAMLKRLEQEEDKSLKKKNPLQQQDQQPPPKNRKRDELTVLQEGLSKPLDESNVGFKLLAKMGYKPTTSNNSSTGEPASKSSIEVHIKQDRSGIGIAELERKQARLMMEEETRKTNERMENETEIKSQYLQSHGSRYESRRLRNHVIKIKQAEANLRDLLKLEPLLDGSAAAPSEDPDEISLENDETSLLPTTDNTAGSLSPVVLELLPQGEMVEPNYAQLLNDYVKKLKKSPYFYCYFCGCRYSSEEELLASCPGNSESDHE
jgi:hypothetical protein